MKNRFNRITSKEWLPFQKSWFRFESDEKLLTDNIRFFCKAEIASEKVFYYGPHIEPVQKICSDHQIDLIHPGEPIDECIQFALIDLRDQINENTSHDKYLPLRHQILNDCRTIYDFLEHRRFICVLVPNVQRGAEYFPYAWDIALQLSTLYSLKDEKICCLPERSSKPSEELFTPQNNMFYCLYFRKDENSSGELREYKHTLFDQITQVPSSFLFNGQVPGWFILKPAPRKKAEILHPAKYPEDLVTMFVNEFTKSEANIFDPMSGTGSTQVAALGAGRNGYGTELSHFFTEIAIERCLNIINPSQKDLFAPVNNQKFLILHKDAREISKNDFPLLDYMITSPPYWDMLNMKGAENQAKRIEKGLQTNYSEDDSDLGNIDDYNMFLSDLASIYFNIADIMKSGSYLTIVVKNIKKKGRNYSFAWNLADKLMEKLILLPEAFWCQDDINLAPYGYGNTFVSNTFHQYCLNFQKP